MPSTLITEVLNEEEINQLLQDPSVKEEQDKLSFLNPKVDFSIPWTDPIKAKVQNAFQLDLSHLSEVPLRWIKGDTPSHKDTGRAAFENTYLLYLTSSVGHLKVDNETYPIKAGNAHIFNEGLAHSTALTGNTDRLMLGPMSETGGRVGASVGLSVVFYSFLPTSAEEFIPYFTYTTTEESANYGRVTIFNVPPPIPVSVANSFTITNNSSLGDWIPPQGKMFNGWKFFDYPNTVPFEQNALSKVYSPGETYTYAGLTYLYANWVPYVRPTMQPLFTNNAQVFYKPHSLAAGSGGVRNHRLIKRKT